MRSRQRTKLMAGAGLATMILGALMVLVPVGAGAEDAPVLPTPYGIYGDAGNNVNLKCSASANQPDITDGTAYDLRADTADNPSLDFVGLSDVAAASYETVAGTDPLQIVWSSPSPVEVIIVKQATYSAVFDVNGAMSGTVYVALPEGAAASAAGLSHVDFCGGSTSAEPKLTVTKKVDTDDEFAITVSQDETEFSETETLGNDESIVVEDADGSYVISEELPEGWQDPAFECGEAEWSDAEGVFTVEVDDEDVTCTVTNTPEEEQRPKVVVRKQVVNRADWSFDFEICEDVALLASTEGQAQAVPQDCEDFTLTDEAPSQEFFRWGTVRITETDGSPAGWALTGIVCVGSPQTTTSVSTKTAEVNVGETAVTTCTFTNTYTTTNTVVTTPTTTPAPASLTVVKDVTGDVPDEWEFTFRLGGDDNELFTLDGTAEGTTDEQTFELPAGDYSVREFDLPNDGSTLVDVDCLDGEDVVGDEDGDTVSLALAAGDDVTCTFTNNFVDVQPSEVTVPPTTQPTPSSTVPPTTAKPTAVLGAQVTRTLPRTGNETRDLAGLGAALIGLGAALVVGSRRREDFVS